MSCKIFDATILDYFVSRNKRYSPHRENNPPRPFLNGSEAPFPWNEGSSPKGGLGVAWSSRSSGFGWLWSCGLRSASVVSVWHPSFGVPRSGGLVASSARVALAAVT